MRVHYTERTKLVQKRNFYNIILGGTARIDCTYAFKIGHLEGIRSAITRLILKRDEKNLRRPMMFLHEDYKQFAYYELVEPGISRGTWNEEIINDVQLLKSITFPAAKKSRNNKEEPEVEFMSLHEVLLTTKRRHGIISKQEYDAAKEK